MTYRDGVYEGRGEGPMFVGWDKAPGVDRRFLFGAIPLALGAVGGLSYVLSSRMDDPGAGAWLTGATHVIDGVVVSKPYPMIRTPDPAAPFGMRTALIVSEAKCTNGLEYAALEGAPARASGVLIERGARRMLEVPLATPKWLEPLDEIADAATLARPPEERLGRAELAGNIMDSKCFFGVMKPARGRTHKACAALCVRSGIPPSFWARTRDGREAVLLVTDAAGGPLTTEILPLIADPVRATGEIVRVGDLLQFRADVGDYERV
ncbi:MAG: hypothetical protein ACFB00_06460 [Parvularculaceae bacterium]